MAFFLEIRFKNRKIKIRILVLQVFGFFLFKIYLFIEDCSEEQEFYFPNFAAFDDEESKVEFESIQEREELEEFSKMNTIEVRLI